MYNLVDNYTNGVNMKTTKLLATTFIIQILSMSSNAAESKTDVSGSADFRMSFTNQSYAYRVTTDYNSNDRHSNTLARLNIDSELKSDTGLLYGASIELGDASTSPAGTTQPLIRSSYLFTESKFGRTELGTNEPASKIMKLDASSIAKATGGVDGDAFYYNNNIVGHIDEGSGLFRTTVKYITGPNLPIESRGELTGRYNKITYFTPEFSGFQIGVSYAPDTAEMGGLGNMKPSKSAIFDTDPPNQYNDADFKNLFTGGISYNTKLSYDIDLKLSSTWQFAEAKPYNSASPASYEKIRDIKAYALGTQIEYKNYAIAGSISHWGRSMNTYVNDVFNNANSRYYTIGMSYTADKYGISLTYMNTSRMKSKVYLASLGLEYNLGSGLLPYIEGNLFGFKPYGVTYKSDDTSNNAIAPKNRGNVVLMGMKVKF